MTPLLTAEDLAPLLGLSADQVRKLAREGIIPQHRIGGAIRFDYEAVKMATGPRYTATGMDKEGCQKRLDQFQKMVIDWWGTEGRTGNEYKIAHFDGVTALARDLGLIDNLECEQRRRGVRQAVGYDQ